MPQSHVERLRQRKFFRWAAAYLAAAWLLFEVASEVGGPLGWSDTFYRTLLVVLGVGFLAALVLAWYHGERGRQRVGTVEAVLLLLLAAVGTRAVFLVQQRESGDDPGTAAVSDAPAGTIAILAFRDLSASGDQTYFAEGMAVEIQGLLSRVPGLRVAASMSAFSFRDTPVDVRVMGERLGVRYVLDGAVTREADHVRISSQLIDARDGFEVWSESFNRELRSVMEIQEEIAALVVSELLPHLTTRPAVSLRTTSTDAHLAYLRGRYQWSRQANEAAVREFETAIALDSAFADAWAGLGTALTIMATLDPSLRERADRAVQRAIDLDPDSPDALSARARTDLTFRYDWAAAERALERSVALDPNHVETRHWYSHVLSWTGRADEGLEQARTAAVLDPLSPFMNLNLAVALWWAGEREEALTQVRHTVRLDPDFLLAYLYLWDYLLDAGRPDEARDVLVAWAEATGGPAEAALEVASAIEEHLSTGRPVPVPEEAMASLDLYSAWVRRVYDWLGQDALALAELWHAHADRSGSYDLLGLRHSGQYASLRDDPRFRQLMEEVGPDAR
ncbi:MAG TPA: hypothetical protein VLA43_03815 [Longimicrobiales bacterium]|nr:hypothetical protein [Longimicrobiales bacterium]